MPGCLGRLCWKSMTCWNVEILTYVVRRSHTIRWCDGCCSLICGIAYLHNMQEYQWMKDQPASTKKVKKMQFFWTSRLRNCILLGLCSGIYQKTPDIEYCNLVTHCQGNLTPHMFLSWYCSSLNVAPLLSTGVLCLGLLERVCSVCFIHLWNLNYVTFISGKISKVKVEQVRAEMEEKGARLLVVCALDEIACEWMKLLWNILVRCKFLSYVFHVPSFLFLVSCNFVIGSCIIA